MPKPTSGDATQAFEQAVTRPPAERDVLRLYVTGNTPRSSRAIAAPTLMRKLPLPLRRMVGDMSGTERLLAGSDLRTK